MKKFIMSILLISLLILSLGCENSKTEVKEPNKGETVVVGYSEDDSDDIFGDLSEEEIKNIIEKITNKVSEDEEYRIDKKDSIIEDVFRENDINDIEDENKINAAKYKLTISK